jgi:hypothetical protein
VTFETWFIELIDEFWRRGWIGHSQLLIDETEAVRRQWESLYASEAQGIKPQAV